MNELESDIVKTKSHNREREDNIASLFMFGVHILINTLNKSE